MSYDHRSWPTQTITTGVGDDRTIIDEEQRIRICDWLRANGIDPAMVVPGSITIVQLGGRAPAICFRQYDIHPDGGKYVDPLANEPVPATFERHLLMKVPLPPQPVAAAREV